MLRAVLSLLILCLAYLLLWPVPIEPEAWEAPVDKGLVGPFAVNQGLVGHEHIALPPGHHGPEAAVVGADGALYTSTVTDSGEGWLLRMAPGGAFEPWVRLPGRPLGLIAGQDSDLWVADAFDGLFRVTLAGVVSRELDSVDGLPLLYADDLAMTPDGKIYLSDASTRHGAKASGDTLKASLIDIMEHASSGRVVEFDSRTGLSRTVMSGLNFSNGVAADPQGRFILVNETAEYRVWKYWLTGERAGTSEVLIDNLPGFPDNIVTATDGRYWLGLVSPRSPILDKLAGKPFVRKIVQRLPAFMRPDAQHYGHIVAINEEGKVLADLQDPSGQLHTTTGAVEIGGDLYITSLSSSYMGKLSGFNQP